MLTIKKSLLKLNDSKGIALITVLMLTMVMAILAIGLISINSSQLVGDESQVDRIKAEELAKGAHWYNYMAQMINGESAQPQDETLDEKRFQIQSLRTGDDNGKHGTATYTFNVIYR